MPFDVPNQFVAFVANKIRCTSSDASGGKHRAALPVWVQELQKMSPVGVLRKDRLPVVTAIDHTVVCRC